MTTMGPAPAARGLGAQPGVSRVGHGPRDHMAHARTLGRDNCGSGAPTQTHPRHKSGAGPTLRAAPDQVRRGRTIVKPMQPTPPQLGDTGSRRPVRAV